MMGKQSTTKIEEEGKQCIISTKRTIISCKMTKMGREGGLILGARYAGRRDIRRRVIVLIIRLRNE